jgi:hypothetical protein
MGPSNRILQGRAKHKNIAPIPGKPSGYIVPHIIEIQFIYLMG